MAGQTPPGARPNRDGTRGMFAKAITPRERCQARRPGRLLEAMCKHCPRGMAVTHRPCERAVPYRTRLTGRLMSLEMRGPAQPRRAPRHLRGAKITFAFRPSRPIMLLPVVEITVM